MTRKKFNNIDNIFLLRRMTSDLKLETASKISANYLKLRTVRGTHYTFSTKFVVKMCAIDSIISKLQPFFMHNFIFSLF